MAQMYDRFVLREEIWYIGSGWGEHQEDKGDKGDERDKRDNDNEEYGMVL